MEDNNKTQDIDKNKRNDLIGLVSLMQEHNNRFLQNMLELQKLDEESTKLWISMIEEDPVFLPTQRDVSNKGQYLLDL